MIISKTPYRISFFGGGTDYPKWYLEHGGEVLGTTINKYCYISCRELPPFFKYKHRIAYSKLESPQATEEIEHDVIREILKYMSIECGMEIHYNGDIPAQSGMGSSSSFTVGLLKALYTFQDKFIGKQELLQKSLFIEQKLLKENVGSQDQCFASYGGFNHIEFQENGQIQVHPVILDSEKLKHLENKLMLIYTGQSRIAHEIAYEQIQNIPRKYHELKDIQQLVQRALEIFRSPNSDFRDFGKLLNETWKLKQSLSKQITNSTIDSLYEHARQNGAIGGKLLGAGGGGFLLLYVEPENRKNLKESLGNYLEIPFRFDFSGSEIIFYQKKN